MKKILISGFMPFAHHTENSSQVIATLLGQSSLPGIDLRSVILPVTYHSAFENLKVEMENGILYIEGKRMYKLNGEDAEKSISQKFKIGQEYNPDNIEATIEDGILTVFVHNYKKTEKKKRISLL